MFNDLGNPFQGSGQAHHLVPGNFSFGLDGHAAENRGTRQAESVRHTFRRLLAPISQPTIKAGINSSQFAGSGADADEQQLSSQPTSSAVNARPVPKAPW